MFISLYNKSSSGGFEGQIGNFWWTGHRKLWRISFFWTQPDGEHKLLWRGPFGNQRKAWVFVRGYGGSKRTTWKAVFNTLKWKKR